MIQAETMPNLEETLQLKEWGKWVRNDKQDAALSRPGWVNDIIKGWREDPREIILDINEDYAMELEGYIAKLPRRQKQIVFSYYVGRNSINAMARALRTTRHIVKSDLDMSLSFLYGQLL